MPAEVVQLFPENGKNPDGCDEVLGFVARKLDELMGQQGMEKLEDFTGAVFNVKSEMFGQLALSLIKKKHAHLLDQEYCPCPKCRRSVKAWNKKVKRRVESLAGSFDLFRPYFYCKSCGFGFYPLDEALGLAAGPKQHDIQEVEAWLSSELLFDTAAEAFKRCTGDDLSADHMHTIANRVGGDTDRNSVMRPNERFDIGLIARAPSGTPGSKRGIIALMKEYPTIQFSILDHGPAPSTRWVQFLLALPGKRDSCISARILQAAIHIPLDQPELKVPRAVLSEREMSRNLHADVSLVPGFHFHDLPTADKLVKAVCHLFIDLENGGRWPLKAANQLG